MRQIALLAIAAVCGLLAFVESASAVHPHLGLHRGLLLGRGAGLHRGFLLGRGAGLYGAGLGLNPYLGGNAASLQALQLQQQLYQQNGLASPTCGAPGVNRALSLQLQSGY